MKQEATHSAAPSVASGKEAAALHIPAPQAAEKPTPRQSLALPIQLDRGYLAQLVIPRDMSRAEMLRLRRILWTLAVPGAAIGEKMP